MSECVSDKMFDRLQELKMGAAAQDEVEEGRGDGRNSNSMMQQFFADVDIIKASITVVQTSTRKISEIHQSVVQSTTADRERECADQLAPLVRSTNKKAANAKQLLTRLRDDTAKMAADAKPESRADRAHSASTSADRRIRENLCGTLTRKFVDVMREYQATQANYTAGLKKKMLRQAQIVRPGDSRDGVDMAAMADGGGGSEMLLRTAILAGPRHAADAVSAAHIGVADRHQDVLALESSVAELHQMLADFALLTTAQGDLLDQIEHNVSQAVEHVDKGNVHIVDAITIQQAIRAKQCCIALVVLAIVGTVVAVIAAKLSSR